MGCCRSQEAVSTRMASSLRASSAGLLLTSVQGGFRKRCFISGDSVFDSSGDDDSTAELGVGCVKNVLEGSAKMIIPNDAEDRYVEVAYPEPTSCGTNCQMCATAVDADAQLFREKMVSSSRLRRSLHKLCATSTSSVGDENESLVNKVKICLNLTHDQVWLANSKSRVAGGGCGSTPLISAVKNKHAQVVRVLLDVHADPTLSNWWGKSALSYAEAISQKGPECEVAADILTMLRDKVHKLDVAGGLRCLEGAVFGSGHSWGSMCAKSSPCMN